MRAKLGRYRHYKGNEYELIGVAKHSETLADMAVYRALYGGRQLWARPLGMFLGTVIVNGKKIRRFSPIKSSRGYARTKRTALKE